MMVFYYFLKDIETSKELVHIVDKFIGDVNEYIVLDGTTYLIDDYAEEYEVLDIPEDFRY